MNLAFAPIDSASLMQLWQRRQVLSSEEMVQMYEMVGDALKSCRPPELQALGESHAELVAQFIYLKVLRLESRPDDEADKPSSNDRAAHSAPSNAFALCAYFRRYLIDCTRASAFKRKLSLGDDFSDAQLEQQLGTPEPEGECALAEHGLTGQAVFEAAQALIASLPEAERLLLCECFGQETAGGLSGVAARHSIASYHYRAGRLGLVHKRTGLPADYARTTLGQWLSGTLGIAIEPENAAAILHVFKILGVQASCV